jgi:hypothetical protein
MPTYQETHRWHRFDASKWENRGIYLPIMGEMGKKIPSCAGGDNHFAGYSYVIW